ncbi:hypothetical protein FSST1_009980 [Fusarium sambucinum]
MSPKNNDHGETTTNIDDPAKPVDFGPYLSPPNSPPKNKEVHVDKAGALEDIGSHLLTPPSSPPQQPSELPAPEKQVKENAIDVTTLRNLLGLKGRCGAYARKTGKPCGQWSPAANKVAVTSQLKSMTNLTQSSTDLEDQLDKLARLVHCRYHDCGELKKDRIEAWKKVFPPGEVTVTDPTILFDKQIMKLLALDVDYPTTCRRLVEDTQSRCNQGIGGLRVSHRALTIDEIITSRAYLNDSHLEGLLEVLERSMYCPTHTKEKNLQMLASWKYSITELLVKLPKKEGEEASEENEGPPEDSSTDSEPNNISPNKSDSLILNSEILPIPDFDQDLSAYWPVTYITSPFEIVMRSNNLSDYRSSYPMIKQKITKALKTVDHSDGYIYMYEVEGNPGFVKIGYTTHPSVDKRLEEWEFDCNRVSKALYPIPLSTAELVPHAHRVEALCHAELDHRRIRIYCHACLKPHIEWFEVSSTDAIKIIQKWSRWMKTNPYKPPALREGKKWMIKIEEMARMERMDDFMDDLSVAS